MTAVIPDPGRARTLDQLSEELRSLKVWAGDPSYEWITGRINEAWTAAGRPAGELTKRPTVVDCFKPGRRRLNTDLVIAVVQALHPDVGYVTQWRQALRVIGGETRAAAQVRTQDRLPPDLVGFTGRTTELDQLRRALHRGAVNGGAVVISAIEGMAGVGKTQLAVHAGHLLTGEMPFDRVLFVNLRGFYPDPAQPPADPTAVLDGFLRLLGVPGQQIPHDMDARAAAYRGLLAGTRTLVVLDNAADADQVRPLLPETPGCLTLVTSRRSLTDLHPVTHLAVDVFTPDEALEFLTRAAPHVPVGDAPDAAARIAQRCGYLPLALGLVAGHMRAKPDWTLTDRTHPRRAATLWKEDSRGFLGCGPRLAAFEPTGTILVTAHSDGTARLWNLADLSPLGSVRTGPELNRTGVSPSLAFGAAGRTLVALGADKSLRMWDLADPRAPRTLPGLPDQAGAKVYAHAVSPDGGILATANDDGMIQFWSLATPDSPTWLTERNSAGTYAIAFSQDGIHLATAGRDGATQLWTLTDPHHPVVVLSLTGHSGDIRAMVFSADGQTLITGAGAGDATVRLTDISPYALTNSASGSGALTFGAHGTTLAITTPDQRIHLRNLADSPHPTEIGEIEPSAGLAGSFDVDRRLLATVDTDHTPHLWDTSTTPPTKIADLPTTASTITLSPNHQLAVTADPHGSTQLWDITNPHNPVWSTDLTHNPSVPLLARSVVFSPDSRFLITMESTGPHLWDINHPDSPVPMADLGGFINFATFSPDNHLLVAIEPDTTHIFDITDPHTRREVATIPVHTTQNPNNLNTSVVAFHPDGHTLAIATREHTTQLWNLTNPDNPEQTATIPAQDGPVTALAFSPNGHTLTTITDKSTVQLWDPQLDNLTAHICRIAHPRITTAEWNRYIPNTAYRPPCG